MVQRSFLMQRPSIPGGRWGQFRRSLWIGLGTAALLLVLWGGGFFAEARLRLNDVYFAPSTAGDTIRMIAIDDASFARYGRSLTDWSRRVFADLIDVVSGAGARVIAFDVLFRDPSADDARLIESIRAARASEARTRTLIIAVGAQVDQALRDQMLHFRETVTPLPAIAETVEAIGYVNAIPDADNALRRQISRVSTPDGTAYSLGIAAYLAYLRIPPVAYEQVITSADRALFVTPERRLPVDEYGLWMPNYFVSPDPEADAAYPVYSLQAVVSGEVDPAVFADKIVMVGTMNALTATDLYTVPTSPGNRLLAGVELHAYAVETLLQNNALVPQPPLHQAIMIAVLAVASSIVYGQLRWYWMIPAAAAFIVIWILIAFASFSLQRVTLDLYDSILALAFPVIVILLADFAQEARQRQANEFLLQSVVDVSEQQLALMPIVGRVGGDLQRLVPDSSGVIWMPANGAERFGAGFAWGHLSPDMRMANHTAAVRAADAESLLYHPPHLAIPVRWQGKTLAVFGMVTPPRMRLTPHQRNLLKTLAAQIAPSLENALLYDQTLRQKSLLEALLQGSPAGMLVLNDAQIIQNSNPAFMQAFSVDVQSLIGCRFADLLAQLDIPEEVCESLCEPLAHWKPFREQLKHRGKTLIVDAAPLEGFREWILVFADVSVLAELSELKTQMIRMASHDLNNPLTNISITVALIKEDSGDLPIPDAYQQAFDRIERASNQMRVIIEDILSLERARSNALIRAPLDFCALVSQVCEHAQHDALAKAQTFLTDLEPEIPPVSGDAAQLRQVIQNLVGNAIKYTPEGGTITVRLLSDIDRLLLEVEDTGYGIPEADQKSIFREFFRARSGATASIKGTGLGLSLVKSVVTAHEGRVWFRSVEGVGTTFFLELPFAEAEGE
ncbi:MAG: CHASE2 domain-containing protein [bacterium]|nr:CHASE2 domain-containing protein [bacterium]